jgi:hypothetical protein
MERGLFERQRQPMRLRKESRQRICGETAAPLRPIRRAFVAALVLAAGGLATLVTVTAHWCVPVH